MPDSILPLKDRWAHRQQALMDTSMSDGARLLYALMDDWARGDNELYMKQRKMAVGAGLCDRELRNRLHELESAGYIGIVHKMTGNHYVFHRHAGADSNRHGGAARIGTPVPTVYTRNARAQERQQEIHYPPTPASGGFLKCEVCRGKGQRPGAIRGSCPGPCKGSGYYERRSA